MGRTLIIAGLLLAAVGVLVLFGEKMSIPLGRLPGDIRWSRGNSSFYFPITTCILISVLGSLVMWFLGRR
jgi:hypothetical protein